MSISMQMAVNGVMSAWLKCGNTMAKMCGPQWQYNGHGWLANGVACGIFGVAQLMQLVTSFSDLSDLG